MTKRKKIVPAEIADTVYASIVASPKRQKRLKSSTFWDMFDYSYRTANRVAEIAALLVERNITCTLADGEFGREEKDEWLILSVLEPPHPPGIESATVGAAPAIVPPPDKWFEQLATREYESEREVEHYFVLPLLDQLGYAEEDIAIGPTVEMFEGVKRVKKEADIIVYNGQGRSPSDTLIVVETKDSHKLLTADHTGQGRSPSDTLIVVETKDSHKLLTADHTGQARSYAMWTRAPYYVVTNGVDTEVWLFRGAVQQDIRILPFARTEIKSIWPSLHAKLSRDAVVGYKHAMDEAADRLGETS
jgi:hypothetical protein